MEIIALASLCKLAIEGGTKVLEEYKKRKLSEAEKELLIAAAQLGEFQIMSADEVPDWIRVGRKNFPEDIAGDPAIAEKYHDAFESLCKRGYIRHDVGILFRLTSKGFEKARELAGKNKKK
ncbi:hypothetical protein ES703_06111 [subsurface metagenome]